MTEKGDPRHLRDFVVEQALAKGAVRCGVTDLSRPAHYASYEAWLARGDHGEMAYMAEEFHTRSRADGTALLPSARSAVVVAFPYQAPPATSAATDEARGHIAAYALGDDYHHVLRGVLTELACDLDQHLAAMGRQAEHRACVDSAPLLERELAERAGMGFVGKNTMLISPGTGSYTLLGVLLSSLEIAPSEPDGKTKGCGSCRACLDACPTAAFRDAYQLDARKCISYLTIESKSPIAEPLRQAVGTRIFGCDACQSVCPYNASAPGRQKVLVPLQPRDAERHQPPLHTLARLGSNPHKRFVAGSAMRRNSRTQLRRNTALALGNAEHLSDEDREALLELSRDADATVREQARWSLRRHGLDRETPTSTR